MRKYILAGAAVILAGLFLICSGPLYLLQIVYELGLGWIAFLSQVVPRLQVNWGGAATAVVCLVAFSIGFHRFAGWLRRGLVVETQEAPVKQRRWEIRWTLATVGVIVLLFAAGVAAVGMTHQSAWLATSPEPLAEGSLRKLAAEANLKNQLRQIGLAAHAHHDVNKSFPPGGAYDEHGNGLHGWGTFLLPYLEQVDVFKRVDLSVSWRHPKNVGVFQVFVPQYLNPLLQEEKDIAGFGLSHFAGNCHVFNGGPALSMKDFKDGPANTLLIGEAAGNFKPWGHPANWRDPGRGILTGPDSFGTLTSPKGAYFVFADGSVRFLRKELSPEVLKALATPRGGEKLPDNWDD